MLETLLLVFLSLGFCVMILGFFSKLLLIGGPFSMKRSTRSLETIFCGTLNKRIISLGE